jgi:hypothetical protein
MGCGGPKQKHARDRRSLGRQRQRPKPLRRHLSVARCHCERSLLAVGSQPRGAGAKVSVPHAHARLFSQGGKFVSNAMLCWCEISMAQLGVCGARLPIWSQQVTAAGARVAALEGRNRFNPPTHTRSNAPTAQQARRSRVRKSRSARARPGGRRRKPRQAGGVIHLSPGGGRQ